MYKIYVAAMILCLAVIANCEVQENESVTSIENTTDVDKVVDKRQIVEATASISQEPTGQNVLGIGSLGLQVITGILENMLSTNGLNTEAVGSLINLFNPEKLRNDLLLIRRIFNLFARFGIVLNRYLPSPSTTGNSFKPIDLLSSKIRLYTPTSAENVEWVPIINNDNSQSPQMVDSVNQEDLDSAATETAEFSSELGRNLNFDMDVRQRADMPDIEMETSISTNSNQNNPEQDDDVNILTSTEENTIDETISLQNKLSNVNQTPKKVLPPNDFILTENQERPEKSATKLRPNAFIGNVKKVQQPRKPALEYGVPPNVNKQENVSTDDLLSEGTENKIRRNKISEEYRLPLVKKRGSRSEKGYVSATVPAYIRRVENYNSNAPNKDNLTYRPGQQEYKISALNTNTNNSDRRGEKSGVPSVRSSHSKKSSYNEKRVETNNLPPSIALVPLQRHRILEKVHGPLYDSFGVPVRV